MQPRSEYAYIYAQHHIHVQYHICAQCHIYANYAYAYIIRRFDVNEVYMQRAGVGKWASCVRVVDPVEGETKQLIEMWEDEAAVSVCVAR